MTLSSFNSLIGERMTMGDLCYMGPGMLNKLEKKARQVGIVLPSLLMAHNVYATY